MAAARGRQGLHETASPRLLSPAQGACCFQTSIIDSGGSSSSIVHEEDEGDDEGDGARGSCQGVPADDAIATESVDAVAETSNAHPNATDAADVADAADTTDGVGMGARASAGAVADGACIPASVPGVSPPRVSPIKRTSSVPTHGSIVGTMDTGTVGADAGASAVLDASAIPMYDAIIEDISVIETAPPPDVHGRHHGIISPSHEVVAFVDTVHLRAAAAGSASDQGSTAQPTGRESTGGRPATLPSAPTSAPPSPNNSTDSIDGFMMGSFSAPNDEEDSVMNIGTASFLSELAASPCEEAADASSVSFSDLSFRGAGGGIFGMNAIASDSGHYSLTPSGSGGGGSSNTTTDANAQPSHQYSYDRRAAAIPPAQSTPTAVAAAAAAAAVTSPTPALGMRAPSRCSTPLPVENQNPITHSTPAAPYAAVPRTLSTTPGQHGQQLSTHPSQLHFLDSGRSSSSSQPHRRRSFSRNGLTLTACSSYSSCSAGSSSNMSSMRRMSDSSMSDSSIHHPFVRSVVFEHDGVAYHRKSKAWSNPFLGSFLTRGPGIDDDGWCYSTPDGGSGCRDVDSSAASGGKRQAALAGNRTVSTPTRLDGNRSFFQKAAKQVYGWLKDRRGLQLEDAGRDAVARAGPGFLTRGIALERSGCGGFGFDVAIDENGIVVVTALYQGGPAEAAGVSVGDALVGVDEDILVGVPGEQICKRIHVVDDTLAIKVASHARVLEVMTSASPLNEPPRRRHSLRNWFSPRASGGGSSKKKKKKKTMARKNLAPNQTTGNDDAAFYISNFW